MGTGGWRTVSASKFMEVSLIGTLVLSTYFESVANVGEFRGSELKSSCGKASSKLSIIVAISQQSGGGLSGLRTSVRSRSSSVTSFASSSRSAGNFLMSVGR